jgi:hypothetical protein
MIKLLLCLLLAACGAYGWRERRMSPLVGYATPLLAIVGIVLVLHPELSSRLAQTFGVGRGADLVFYLWTVLSALLIANVHFRLRYQKEMLTTLARDLALLSATHQRRDHGDGATLDGASEPRHSASL